MLPLFSGVSLTSNHIAIVPRVQITGFNAMVVSVQLRINCTPKRGVICTTSRLVLVIGMSGVQLQINHDSLPKERKILSECEARG